MLTIKNIVSGSLKTGLPPAWSGFGNFCMLVHLCYYLIFARQGVLKKAVG